MLLALHAHSDFEGGLKQLTAAEQAHFSTLKIHKRRHEWLLGRLTVKRVVGRFVARRDGVTLAPHQIEVLPDVDRSPAVSFIGHELAAVEVSLSHRGELALAGVADAGATSGFGVDLERVEPRAPAFLKDWFDADEQALIDGEDPLARDRRVSMFWCAKEAVLKAAKKGLSVSADRVKVRCIHEDGTIDVRCDPSLFSGAVVARCWHLPGYVLTWAAFEGSRGPLDEPLPPHPACRRTCAGSSAGVAASRRLKVVA